METLTHFKEKYRDYSNDQLLEVIVSQYTSILNLKSLIFDKKSVRKKKQSPDLYQCRRVLQETRKHTQGNNHA